MAEAPVKIAKIFLVKFTAMVYIFLYVDHVLRRLHQLLFTFQSCQINKNAKLLKNVEHLQVTDELWMMVLNSKRHSDTYSDSGFSQSNMKLSCFSLLKFKLLRIFSVRYLCYLHMYISICICRRLYLALHLQ